MNAIAIRKAISTTIEQYQRAEELLDEGYRRLLEAEQVIGALQGSIVEPGYAVRRHHQEDQNRLRSATWYVLLRESGVEQILPTRRLEMFLAAMSGDPVPEPTIKEVNGILLGLDPAELFAELVAEAFDILRVGAGAWDTARLKTNQRNARDSVKDKVIIQPYDNLGPRHNSGPNLDVVERVFHILDGKPAPRTDTLTDRFRSMWHKRPCEFETEYFSVKIYKNCRIHITFKRSDLVGLLNRYATTGQLVLPEGKGG